MKPPTVSTTASPNVLTIRDEFAAQTLAGLLARYERSGLLAHYQSLTPALSASYAADAYLLADAMLAERDKPLPAPEPGVPTTKPAAR